VSHSRSRIDCSSTLQTRFSYHMFPIVLLLVLLLAVVVVLLLLP
jgi:hypothetical protein